MSARLDSSRSRAAEAAGPPTRNKRSRWTSARTKLVVISRARRPSASRNSAPASPWCWSRALKSAIQALLSTNSRSGAAGAVPRAGLGNKRLGEVAVDLVAEVWREPLDHPAGCQQWIVLHRPGEGAEGYPDRL